MKALIKWEFKKLLKRKMTVAVIVCAVLITLFNATGISYESTGFSSFSAGGVRVSNAEGVSMNKALAKEYEGVVTDAFVEDIIARFNLDDAIDKIKSKTATAARMRNANAYDCNVMTSFVMHKMISEDGDVRSVREVFGDAPVYFGYSGSYSEIMNDLTIENIVLMIAAIVLFAPLFADERAVGMDRILLSARYGKRKTAIAKCVTALLAVVVLYIGCFLINAGINFLIFGLEGADVSAAAALLSATEGYAMPIWEILLAALVSGFSGVLFCALLAVVLSICMSSFLTLVIGAAILYIPIIIFQHPIANPWLSAVLPLSYCGLSTLTFIYEAGEFFRNIGVITCGALAASAVMAAASIWLFKRSHVS